MREMREEKNSKGKIITAAASLLSLAGVVSLPQMLNLRGRMLGFSNSFFSVLLWLVFSCVLRRILSAVDLKDKRDWLTAGVPSLVFTLCMEFGAELDSVESVDFTDLGMWAALPLLTVFFTVLVRGAWHVLEERFPCEGSLLWGAASREDSAPAGRPGLFCRLSGRWGQLPEKKKAVWTAVLFLLCWLPVLLAVYPGFFVYDAQDEYVQAATRAFTTHHPLLHVALLGGAVLGGHKLTGSYNAGILLYTVFQMLVLSGVFSFVLSVMRRKKTPAPVRALTALYFAFFPVIVMFVLCSAKDGLFTGALLVLFLLLSDMAADPGAFFRSAGKQTAFVLSALLMMLFRHNGFYAYLVFIPILTAALKGFRRRTLLLCASSAAAFILCSGALAALFHAERSESQELLTVPIQQLARTYAFNPEDFTPEQKETLREILSEETLRRYVPKVSDPVKAGFDNQAFSEDKGKYAALWLDIGLSHPLTYLNAWFMTSYGFWYPDTVIDVYRGNTVFTYTYEDSSFFGYEVEQPGRRVSLLPWLDQAYRRMSLEIFQQKIPVISMLFSPGFLFWLYVFAASYLLRRTRPLTLLPLALLFLIWLTVILGPTYLPRYVLFLWFCLPPTLTLTLFPSSPSLPPKS